MSSEKLDQCLKTNDFSNAVVHCDAILAAEPNNIEIQSVKGWCLYKVGQVDNAEAFIIAAFEKNPASSQIATIAMSYYVERHRYRKVVELSQRCISFHPKDRLMWHRLGTAHYMLGENESSLMAFTHALSITFAATSAFGMSMPLLAQGRYEEAFPLYENRFLSHPKLDWIKSENLPMPKWQGERIQGKSLLLWSEQGLGDSLQFSRLVNELVSHGATVDIILQLSHVTLLNVLSTLQGVGQVMMMDGNSVTFNRRYDYHSPMMSLMGLMSVRIDNIPARVPYLSVPENAKLAWQESKYTDVKGLKVGLVWSTLLTDSLLNENAMHYEEKNKKSLPIAAIQQLLTLPNVHFFVLHVSVSEADQQWLSQYNVSIMSDKINDFGDTAAIIDHMDMMISIDTSVVHLAGAMAKPTINILPYVSDWRWQKSREDSPWYPTMRLCKQAWKDNWEETIERVIPIVKKATKQWERAEPISVF